jgi:ribosomal protein S18 acetylase RimI-like enzyme
MPSATEPAWLNYDIGLAIRLIGLVQCPLSSIYDGCIRSMTHDVCLRAAEPQDLPFCQRLYFENMGWIIEALKLDTERHSAGFTQQWQVAQVRIISVADEDVGWLQAAPAHDAIFLGQLYLARHLQRQGIGSHVMQILIEEATLARKAITLAVAKINPARGLYERLGFRITHEDQHKVYMRRELDEMASALSYHTFLSHRHRP